MKQNVLILAKSYKPGGRCIAGKIVDKIENNIIYLSNWIRPIPVNTTPINSAPISCCTLQDNKALQTLDIVEVNFDQNLNVVGQPENYSFHGASWEKISFMTPNSICNLIEKPNSLWLESVNHSDFVTHKYVLDNSIAQSLYLIKVTNLIIKLGIEWDTFNNKNKYKIHASFVYNGVQYSNFSITCPALRKALKNKYPGQGQPDILMPLIKNDNYVLCVSLGPNISNNRHYKFVAAVYDFDGYLQRTFNS